MTNTRGWASIPPTAGVGSALGEALAVIRNANFTEICGELKSEPETSNLVVRSGERTVEIGAEPVHDIFDHRVSTQLLLDGKYVSANKDELERILREIAARILTVLDRSGCASAVESVARAAAENGGFDGLRASTNISGRALELSVIRPTSPSSWTGLHYYQVSVASNHLHAQIRTASDRSDGSLNAAHLYYDLKAALRETEKGKAKLNVWNTGAETGQALTELVRGARLPTLLKSTRFSVHMVPEQYRGSGNLAKAYFQVNGVPFKLSLGWQAAAGEEGSPIARLQSTARAIRQDQQADERFEPEIASGLHAYFMHQAG